ncbi:LOW QUALITY PROTEIN: hypothetical protein RJ639_030732 [Escallonia herrerae]|uniref:Uncharacterized protein n=1 Tax=Escallonia herrerae TaxID=1293975 RepID=A0AA89BLI2_9ASTE|nr:LOW QUALITY PROTEIN: hypothetical protein RJ639_030732 [Escallonia herrerae]
MLSWLTRFTYLTDRAPLHAVLVPPCVESEKDVSCLTTYQVHQKSFRYSMQTSTGQTDLMRPLKGCIGFFHVAHTTHFEETQTKQTVSGALGILQPCLKLKTVSVVTDESSWADVNYVRALKPVLASYFISKTLTEQAALQFAEKIDLVTVIPSLINGPFICPQCPGSVRSSSATISVISFTKFFIMHLLYAGDYDLYKHLLKMHMVYVDDVKLLDTGFNYKYGLEAMYDGAIECCKIKEHSEGLERCDRGCQACMRSKLEALRERLQQTVASQVELIFNRLNDLEVDSRLTMLERKVDVFAEELDDDRGEGCPFHQVGGATAQGPQGACRGALRRTSCL